MWTAPFVSIRHEATRLSKRHLNLFYETVDQLTSSSRVARYLDLKRNSVNLGALYTPNKDSIGGWAYMQDGSIYIQASGYVSHEVFENHMRRAQSYFEVPERSKRSGHSGPNPEARKQIIIQLMFPSSSQTLIHHRWAKDREEVFNKRFVKLDPTSHVLPGSPVSLRSMKPLVYRALETFRGTLIDGKLQPNVRLGNGLVGLYTGEPKIMIPYPAKTTMASRRLFVQQSKTARVALKNAREQELELREKNLHLSLENFRQTSKAARVALENTREQKRVALKKAREQQLESQEQNLHHRLENVRQKSMLEGQKETIGKQKRQRMGRNDNTRRRALPTVESLEELGYKMEEGHLDPPSDDTLDLYGSQPPRSLLRIRERHLNR